MREQSVPVAGDFVQEMEADFQADVIAAAEGRGWLWFHCYDSRRSPPGFPDLVLAHPKKA